jgi:hypothetical protein
MTVSRWSTLILVLLFALVAGSISCGGQSAPAASLQSPSEPTVVSVVSGEVMVMKAGADTWIEVSPGMTLGVGDRLKTGPGSKAVITFFEGTTIELAEDTEVGVAELGVAGETGSTAIKLQQQIGKTTSRVQKLVDPASRYEIETPDGAAVVRGSVGDVIVTEGNSTTIINRQGQWSAIFNGVEIPIPQGYQITFVRGQLTIPVPVPVPLPAILPPPSPPSSPAQSIPPWRSSQPPSTPAAWQAWTQTTANDFNAGTCDNVTVVTLVGGDGTVILIIDQRKGGYVPSGTLESSSYDCGSIAEFGTISWDAAIPGGTVLKFQVATNNDNSTWNFVGPDGTTSTYYMTSNAVIWSGHDGGRFIRYKAYLEATISNVTPELMEVRVIYRRY